MFGENCSFCDPEENKRSKSNLLKGAITIRTGCFISYSYIYSLTLYFSTSHNQFSVLRLPLRSLKRVCRARRPSGTIRPVMGRLHEDLVAGWTMVGRTWRLGGALLVAPNCPQRGVLTEHKHRISRISSVAYSTRRGTSPGAVRVRRRRGRSRAAHR